MTTTTPALSTPEVTDATVLLHPGPLALETGVTRLKSGVLRVAARTDMPRCKSRTFECWFGFAPDTQQYSWRHPTDHVCPDCNSEDPPELW